MGNEYLNNYDKLLRDPVLARSVGKADLEGKFQESRKNSEGACGVIYS